MDKLRDLISSFVEDVATLDVLTLSGTIKLTPDPEPGDEGAKKLNWDAYFKSVVEKMNTADENNKLEVVAYTHAEFDADSVNYYRTAEGDDGLAELHRRTVESATKARMEAVAAFARALKIR